jgi:hypothetical protein
VEPGCAEDLHAREVDSDLDLPALPLYGALRVDKVVSRDRVCSTFTTFM